jgi:hypothetical protein
VSLIDQLNAASRDAAESAVVAALASKGLAGIGEVSVVRVLTQSVWIESDIMSDKHVVVQYEGMEPFTYASFFYNYAYTSNANIRSAAEALAISLGAKSPVDVKSRPIPANMWDSKNSVPQI